MSESVARSMGVLLSAMLVAASVQAAPNLASQDRGFRALAAQQAAAFNLPNDVKLIRAASMGSRGTTERYQQLVNNAEVLGGQLTLIRDSAGKLRNVIGSHYPDLKPSNVIKLQTEDARVIAAAQRGGSGSWQARLMIDPHNGRYFYSVENLRADSRWFYWVDAENGTVINSYDGLTTDSSGIGVLDDSKDLTGLTTFTGSDYEMVSVDGLIKTYDAGNKSLLPGSIGKDLDDNWDDTSSTSPGQAALVDAQFYAAVTNDYYQNKHVFNWVAEYPQGMISSAHLQNQYNNAYWNGTQMAYGDGDGSTFIEFSGDLDVVGHELSHGVTESTSNLIYQNESGALNEAFSDIMGTAIEYYNNTGNWTIGEDIMPSDNGIRNMADPNEDGDPSHYADRYTGNLDNGGVHWNSGIVNHWFYLLVNGGQNANASRASGTNVQRIGLAAAEKIAFTGFTALSSTANFCAARASTIIVAGTYSANVTDAWDEVGVDDALCGGSGGGGSTSSACESPTQLTSGQTITVPDASAGQLDCYILDVPANAIALDITTQAKGGRRAGDADLYGKFGSAPSTDPADSSNECASFSSNSNESCSIPNPANGSWYIVVQAYTAYTGLTLNAMATLDSVTPNPEPSGDLTVSSASSGRTWSATVSHASEDISYGEWTPSGVGENSCDGAQDGSTSLTCTLSGISKKTGSVTFTWAGIYVEIFKP